MDVGHVEVVGGHRIRHRIGSHVLRLLAGQPHLRAKEEGRGGGRQWSTGLSGSGRHRMWQQHGSMCYTSSCRQARRHDPAPHNSPGPKEWRQLCAKLHQIAAAPASQCRHCTNHSLGVSCSFQPHTAAAHHVLWIHLHRVVAQLVLGHHLRRRKQKQRVSAAEGRNREQRSSREAAAAAPRQQVQPPGSGGSSMTQHRQQQSLRQQQSETQQSLHATATREPPAAHLETARPLGQV